MAFKKILKFLLMFLGTAIFALVLIHAAHFMQNKKECNFHKIKESHHSVMVSEILKHL